MILVRFLAHLCKVFIFPSFCASCKIFLDTECALCKECIQKIQPIASKVIQLTTKKTLKVHAIGVYDQPLISLILAKSSGNRAISRQLGILIWQLSVVRYLDFDYIVPIPLHWSRYAWRGYNQAYEMAKVIAKESHKPIMLFLKRARRTPYQIYFKKDERFTNLAHSFELNCDSRNHAGKKLLLVDDVMTSGATLYHAARALQKLRPEKIEAVVIARVG